MDKKKSLLNVMVSMLSKVIMLVAAILVRRYIIRYLGNGINGLNSLFLNMLDVLSLAELGVGEAITYCMYRPIVEQDLEKTSAIYNSLRKIYNGIALAVLMIGLMIMPFLDHFAKDYQSIGMKLQFPFALMLSSTCITYLYGPESALLSAHKKQYIVTAIYAAGRILQYVLQILVLIFTKSFICFLVVRIFSAVCQMVLTKVLTTKQYGHLMHGKQRIDRDTADEIRKNVGAMFMHKVGAVFVGSTDSILISAFVGMEILGKYANYTTIVTSMTGVIGMLFIPLTAIIGHMYFGADREQFRRYFHFFHGFNLCVATIFFLGYYSVINDLISILFGDNQELPRMIILVVTISYFIQFSRRSLLLFRDATGLFYCDRWKSLVEGIVNLILSWIFVQFWGIVGVLAATIITNMCICLVVEPYILHKHVFKVSCIRYYIRNYASIILFVLALLVLDKNMVTMSSGWHQMIVNGMRSICISLVVCSIIIVSNRDFRLFAKSGLRKLSDRLRRA